MKLKTVTSRLLKVVVVIAMFFSAIAINDYIASAEVNDDLSRSITSATIEGENNGSVEVNKGSVNKLTLAIEKDVTEKDKTSFTLGVPENVTISGVTMSSSSINGTTVSASVSKTADNMATVVFNQDALDMVQSITDASYKLNLQLSLDIIFGAEGQYKFNPSANDVKDVKFVQKARQSLSSDQVGIELTTNISKTLYVQLFGYGNQYYSAEMSKKAEIKDNQVVLDSYSNNGQSFDHYFVKFFEKDGDNYNEIKDGEKICAL